MYVRVFVDFQIDFQTGFQTQTVDFERIIFGNDFGITLYAITMV